MPIKYDELMALKNLGQKYAYTDREVMLYAYGIGMGADPMDEGELRFVFEKELQAVPTMATVHPSAVLRSEYRTAAYEAFRDDLAAVLPLRPSE